MQIELLGGAFVATFEKGQKGKPGRWVTTPTFKKPAEKKESLREKPQYAIQEEIERASVKRYQGILRTEVLEITSFIKRVANGQ